MSGIGQRQPILQAVEAFDISPSTLAVGVNRNEVRTFTVTTKSSDIDSVDITLDGDITAVAVTDLDNVFATGTITCVSAIASDTVTFNGLLYTAVAGAKANDTEFSIDTSDTACATDLADSIDDDVRAGTVADASAIAASGVVTITSTAAGTAGNVVTLVSSDGATLAVSGALLTGGVDVGSTSDTATEIAAGDYSGAGTGWTAVADGADVIFTSLDTLSTHTGTYDITNSTSAAGTFNRTTVGQNNKNGATQVALFVGGAGNVDVQIGISRVIFTNIANGTFLPILITKLYPTTTTATAMIALSDGYGQ